jgi:hypothetical protein
MGCCSQKQFRAIASRVRRRAMARMGGEGAFVMNRPCCYNIGSVPDA